MPRFIFSYLQAPNASPSSVTTEEIPLPDEVLAPPPDDDSWKEVNGPILKNESMHPNR
jgi:hypothetical protein